MLSNKRYYWLKLDEAFFEDDTIEWVEEQENGERYVLFYLKLCLKSLKDEGCLIRYVGETLIPYDVKALAKLTNTDQDTVAVSLRVFEEIGLIERRDSGEIYMKQINEMIGSETDAAKRVRKHRAREAMLQSNDDLLQSNAKMLQSNTGVTKCNTEKDIDIEKELRDKSNSKDKPTDYKSVYDYYLSLDLIKHRAYTKDMQKAIKKALRDNKYDEDYCKVLLDRHKQIVDMTKDGEYPVRVRGIAEFFGQKAYNATHLICSEYEEGGKLFEEYLNQKSTNVKNKNKNGTSANIRDLDYLVE